MKTAVEWLESKFSEFETIHYSLPTRLYEYIEQAKEMEKQQIIDVCYFAYNEGCSYMTDGKTEYESFEQYYKETFKKK
jgi:hypothetical protein